jgi:hypothetical protein
MRMRRTSIMRLPARTLVGCLACRSWPAARAGAAVWNQCLFSSKTTISVGSDLGCQTGLVPIAPVGKAYHRRNWRTRKGIIAPLYDVQSVPVQKVGVVAEHFVQFRNYWMVVGDHVSFELGQSLFDLSGIKLHNALH